MKKTIIALFVLLLVPFVASANFTNNLSYGMTGTDVYQLQDILQSEGCLNHVSTGYFGLLTLQAVECYQTNHNIESTGYVAILTRASLNSTLDIALASSTQEQLAETGATSTPTTSFICPDGYVCTPVTQVTTTPVTTTTPVVAPVISSPATNQVAGAVTIATSVTPELKAFVYLKSNDPTLWIDTATPIDFAKSTIELSNGTFATLEAIPDSAVNPVYGTMNGVKIQHRVSVMLTPSPIGNSLYASTTITLVGTDGSQVVFSRPLEGAIENTNSGASGFTLWQNIDRNSEAFHE